MLTIPVMMPAALQIDLELLFRILLSFFLGGLIGLERERHGISAGIRTYGGICMGACVFGILSISFQNADPTRIAAQVATGVGFLGGGVIFRREDGITGLTTAATLWATAALGLAVAFGLYIISVVTSLLIYLMLYLPRLSWWKKFTGHTRSTKLEKE